MMALALTLLQEPKYLSVCCSAPETDHYSGVCSKCLQPQDVFQDATGYEETCSDCGLFRSCCACGAGDHLEEC